MDDKLHSACHLKHFAVALIAIVLTWLIALGFLFSLSFLNPVERAFENFRMTDIFYDAENQEEQKDTSGIITLVDMTDVFNRSRLAEVIEEIDAMDPAIMGIDIVFDGLRDDEVGNERLIETVCNNIHSPVIWAYKLTDWSEEERRFTKAFHSFFVEEYGIDVEEGYTNVQRDVNGGTVRSFGIKRKVQNHFEYSLPARLAVELTGDSTVLKKYDDCTIRYTATVFPTIPFDSIAQNADLIRGHVVLLGATSDKRDLHYTPLGHIAGVKILAYTVQTIVNREIPREFPKWMTMFFTFIFIWIAELFQAGLTSRMKKSRFWIFHKVGEYDLVAEVVAIIYIVLLVGFDYYFFVNTNIYFNTAWTIMGVALLETSRKIYALLRDAYNVQHNKKNNKQ